MAAFQAEKGAKAPINEGHNNPKSMEPGDKKHFWWLKIRPKSGAMEPGDKKHVGG